MHSVHNHAPQQNQGHGYEHSNLHAHGPRTQGRVIRYARVYDPLVWLMALGQTRAFRALPADLARLRPGEQVLDVGCGTGDVAITAARRVGPTGKVYGIDASPEMIAVAQRKAAREGRVGETMTFKVEPVESLSFPNASFDVVLSSLMLHHLPGDLKQRALAEIRRVLRPGGRLVIVDLQPTTRKPRLWEPGWLIMRRHGMQPVPAAEVRARQETIAGLLRNAGFEAIETGTTRYAWMGYARGNVPA